MESAGIKKDDGRVLDTRLRRGADMFLEEENLNKLPRPSRQLNPKFATGKLSHLKHTGRILSSSALASGVALDLGTPLKGLTAVPGRIALNEDADGLTALFNNTVIILPGRACKCRQQLKIDSGDRSTIGFLQGSCLMDSYCRNDQTTTDKQSTDLLEREGLERPTDSSTATTFVAALRTCCASIIAAKSTVTDKKMRLPNAVRATDRPIASCILPHRRMDIRMGAS